MRTRKGFSLIEAAIVLGIVGLVIGGIWVAAASVKFSNDIKDAKEKIGSSINAYMSARASRVDLSGWGSIYTETFANAAKAVGILPRDCTWNVALQLCVSPGRFTIRYEYLGPSVAFVVTTSDVSPMSVKECLAIGRALYDAYRRFKLTTDPSFGAWGVWTSGAAVNDILTLNGTYTPYTDADMNTACTSSNTIPQISLYGVM